MWSIVQSPPTNSLEQVTQIGSRIVLAYSRAFTQALLLCHSAIVYLRVFLLRRLLRSIVVTPSSESIAMMIAPNTQARSRSVSQGAKVYNTQASACAPTIPAAMIRAARNSFMSCLSV